MLEARARADAEARTLNAALEETASRLLKAQRVAGIGFVDWSRH